MKRLFSLVPVLIAVAALGYIFYQHFQEEEPLAVAPAGDYGAADVPLEVDHSAFVSTFLNPAVAKLYGIERDERLGVCVISVYQKNSPGVGVQARVSGTRRNIMGQVTKLGFDEVREGAAVYHVCTFPIAAEEQLTFDVAVEIVGSGESRQMTWQQKF